MTAWLLDISLSELSHTDIFDFSIYDLEYISLNSATPLFDSFIYLLGVWSTWTSTKFYLIALLSIWAFTKFDQNVLSTRFNNYKE